MQPRGAGRLLSCLPIAILALALLLRGPAVAAVVSGNSNLTVGCNSGTTNLSTDWYFPQPNNGAGLVWLQHGFSRANDQVSDLAQKIAQAGYVVFAPTMSSLTGCTINDSGFLTNFAALFNDLSNPNAGLLKSALAAAGTAGVSLTQLPAPMVLSGHSAGAGAATFVSKEIVSKYATPAALLRGLMLLDPVESNSGSLIESSLPALAALRVYTISSPPYSCNSNASGTVVLTNSGRPFVGVRLSSGCHCDAEGASTDIGCTLTCGTSQATNVSALQTLSVAWITDFFNRTYTSTYYPSGTYYESQVSAGRTVSLPEGSTCGNGTLDSGEQCDDGNRSNGDCCNSVCAFETAGITCRAASGACDLAEACTGTSGSCPGDGKSTAVCRSAVATCDAAESCDGVSNDCPPDGVIPLGTECRASAGVCDLAERCTGTSSACPSDLKGTAVCRSSAGPCDVAETCSGSGNDCPADLLLPSTTVCRSAAGGCDIAESCTCTGALCPADVNPACTFTPTLTPTRTPTQTSTPTRTPTVSFTPTLSPTPTRSASPTRTSTQVPTATGTSTSSPTESPTATETATRTETPTSTGTPTTTATATPTVTATPIPVCGNGVLESGELCDDGNLTAVDGCDEACRFELIPGNGNGRISTNPLACRVEFAVRNAANPTPTDRNARPNSVHLCTDNDPRCDADLDPGNKTCEFRVNACLNVIDPNLPTCTGGGVWSPVSVRAPSQKADPLNYGVLAAALGQVRDPVTGVKVPLPVAASEYNRCTDTFSLRVPLRGIAGTRKGKLRLHTLAYPTILGALPDHDRITLICVPPA